jgi:murein DD-endopeptidase MepM/ murein hydrolase activator NlpD
VWRILALFLVLALAGVATFVRCEGEAPTLEVPAAIAVGRDGTSLAWSASDAGAGLRSVRVTLRHAGGETELASLEQPGSLLVGGGPQEPMAFETGIAPKELGLPEGDAFLEIEVRDWSWRNFFRGNVARAETAIDIDLTRPQLRVQSGITYVRRAGAGVVVYQLDEDVPYDGVEVGEAFFPGHPLPGGGPRDRVTIFAVPRDAPENPSIQAVAVDAAGNRTVASWQTRFKESSFDEIEIRLGPGFLQNKVAELGELLDIDEGDPVTTFQVINRDERARNEQQIRDIVAASGDEILFEGGFVQMKNSAVTSRFAEHRTYLVDDQEVSEAIHYGYDLASNAAAPIEAANRGLVLFTGDLGIYGATVILDHGLGLTSLYAHLSRIDVEVGEIVPRGATLGLSGATGLAGGDHLHFAIQASGTYVEPKEWWDARWVKDRFEGLQAAP